MVFLHDTHLCAGNYLGSQTGHVLWNQRVYWHHSKTRLFCLREWLASWPERLRWNVCVGVNGIMLLVDYIVPCWLKCELLSRNNSSLYPADCWGKTCSWEVIQLSICSLKVYILYASWGANRSWIICVSQCICLTFRFIIHCCSANTCVHTLHHEYWKMNCEFIFFEYDSDSQPHNKMHNSHAVLLILYWRMLNPVILGSIRDFFM